MTLGMNGINFGLLFSNNFLLIEEGWKLNQRNCGQQQHTEKLCQWKLPRAIKPTWITFAIWQRIRVRFDIPRRLCETFAIDTVDHDEIMEGKLGRHCSSFEASQQRRLKIELCICDSSWCRREMARIWPQISYSIHQGFFSSRILKSSQHFFQTASLGGGKLDQNNFAHPNQISYRIIRGGGFQCEIWWQPSEPDGRPGWHKSFQAETLKCSSSFKRCLLFAGAQWMGITSFFQP